LVVNTMKGDPGEHRAGSWLEWDGKWDGLRAALLGIPFDGASVVRTGSRHGPDAVRQAMMYFTTYSSADGRVMTDLRAADVGDVEVVLTDMPRTFENIAATIGAIVGRGIVPLSIGGDHSIAFPILDGVSRGLPGARIGIVHFDAHHDLREAHLGAESSGVPFRKALERLDAAVRGRNLVQIGMAEFANSPQLAAYAAEQGATVIPGLEVRRRGIDAVVDQALAVAGDGTDAIYLSIDIDAIDQSQAPGTAAPNPFGLDARDVQWAARRIASDAKTVGFDVVEIAPPFDHGNITGGVGAGLVLNFLYGLSQRGAAGSD
jgi:formimidoylglutamase